VMWLLHPLGGLGYQFWSGIGSDVFLLAPLGLLWRRFNCHEPRCPRLVFRASPDDPEHMLCRRHHRRALGG